MLRLPSLLLALSLLSTSALAAQKSCRNCDCTVTLSGNLNYDHGGPGNEDDQNKIMDAVAQKLSGGDGYYWVTRPVATSKGGPTQAGRRDLPAATPEAGALEVRGTPTGPMAPRGSPGIMLGADWVGKVHFWRLCGNGKEVTTTTQVAHWDPKEIPTQVKLECSCTHSAVCLGGSKCQDSGI